ncbi:outer membrane receptor protein involved in Fe transport [Sphingopyxis panaciterrae]|uniref:TonB-dependent receptor n=1 Tax=Sphingopyxis panaciterrae TaxID=363841 RepID=UPI00142261CF|nr:TonB-dependent receptor [Sphingopyxis panaciterrae]NIJ37375.1 outer membrane receptor protein involved in Fe transport [Sphingopyxis panaciterrae]
MRQLTRSFRIMAITSVASIALVSPAIAQETNITQDAPATSEVSNEIIVTATRREQSVLDVPISIAVVTADEISKRGMVSAEDYLRGIPGVNQTSDPVGSSIIIRGLETSPSFQNFSSGTTVATYFGETPITNSGGLAANTNVDIKLVDIERIEVLRGPQGTSFGDSSLGGAVRVIPARPKTDKVEGHVGAGYSHTGGYGGDNYMLQGTVNVPVIADVLAIRATGYRFSDSGYYRDNANVDPTLQQAAVFYGAEPYANAYSNIGSSKFTGARISALVQPTENLTLQLSYLSQKTELNGNALANSGTYDQALFDVAPQHVIRGQKSGASDMDIDLFNATLEYDLDWGSLLATYSHIDSSALNSSSYSQSNPIWPFSYIQDGKHKEDTGEIRFVSDLSGRFNFLVGAFVQKLTDDAIFNYRWLGTDVANAVTPPGPNDFLDNRSLKQKSAYGEASYEIIDGLTATGGIRYYEYERTVATQTSGAFFGDSNEVIASKSSGTTFRGNLSYKLNPTAMVYATFSQGFRLGKPQPGLPAGVCDLNNDGIVDGSSVTLASTKLTRSDETNNYEIGSKFGLFQNRLTGSVAAFLMDWDGVPFRTSAPQAPTGCGLTYNANAGSARTKGVELQASLAVTDSLRADFGGSYIDAKLTEDAPELGAFSGDRLPGSPKFNANLSLQYDFDAAGHPTFIRVDSIYVGEFYGDIYQSPATKAGDYVKIDLTSRIKFGQLGVDLYVQNLTNEDVYTFRGTSDTGRDFFGYRMRPRTIGARINYSF